MQATLWTLISAYFSLLASFTWGVSLVEDSAVVWLLGASLAFVMSLRLWWGSWWSAEGVERLYTLIFPLAGGAGLLWTEHLVGQPAATLPFVLAAFFLLATLVLIVSLVVELIDVKLEILTEFPGRGPDVWLTVLGL